MFEGMKTKFAEEKVALDKEEAAAVNKFEMLMQDLNNNIKVATEDSESKTATRASKTQKAAQDKSDMGDTQATLDSDTTYLNDLMAECHAKEEAYEQHPNTA